MYGIMEKQFRKLLTEAARLEGNTGENLLRLLEMRLDNVVYRLGLVPTRNMARQVVSHGHVRINNKKLNIPSYQVKIGDEIAISEPMVRTRESVSVPTWLDRQGIIGRIVSKPNRSDTIEPVSEQLIVEFYSR